MTRKTAIAARPLNIGDEIFSPAPLRHSALPASLAPRGLSRLEAAAYLGISTSLFDALVAERKLPRPKTIHSRRVFDRKKLDMAFDKFPGDSEDEEVEEFAV